MTSPERFGWDDDDLVAVRSDWTLSYELNGGTHLVDDYDSLNEYTFQKYPGRNEAERMTEFVKTLSPAQVHDMPSQLRDELLNAGYDLP